MFKTIHEGPADGVMVISLDSHIVDRGLSPGPGGLKHAGRMYVLVQNPERRLEEKGSWHGHPPWGMISCFLSLSLSLSLSVFLVSACKNLSKNKEKKRRKEKRKEKKRKKVVGVSI